MAFNHVFEIVPVLYGEYIRSVIKILINECFKVDEFYVASWFISYKCVHNDILETAYQVRIYGVLLLVFCQIA